MNRKTFLKAMIVPAVILLGFIVYNYYTLSQGNEILLKTAPVDPNDLFRGNYVNLRYDISTIDLNNVTYDMPFVNGDDIFAVLVKGDKYWSVTGIRHYIQRPQSNEVIMKGKVAYSYGDQVNVLWGIESYFVSEGKGQAIEREIRDVSVKVSVDSTGRALIKKLYVNDIPVDS